MRQPMGRESSIAALANCKLAVWGFLQREGDAMGRPRTLRRAGTSSERGHTGGKVLIVQGLNYQRFYSFISKTLHEI